MKKFTLLLSFALLFGGAFTFVAPTEAKTIVYKRTFNAPIIRNGIRYYPGPNGSYYRGPRRTYVTRNGRHYYSYRKMNGVVVTRRY